MMYFYSTRFWRHLIVSVLRPVALTTKRLRRIGVAAGLCTILVALFLLPSARLTILGVIKGESFYRGRPVSYWKNLIRESPQFPYQSCYPPPGFELFAPCNGLEQVKMKLGLKYTVDLVCLPLRAGDPGAVPVLIEMLDDTDPVVRGYAAESLGALGAKAMHAVPWLRMLVDDSEVANFGLTVGEKAGEALKQIQGE